MIRHIMPIIFANFLMPPLFPFCFDIDDKTIAAMLKISETNGVDISINETIQQSSAAIAFLLPFGSARNPPSDLLFSEAETAAAGLGRAAGTGTGAAALVLSGSKGTGTGADVLHTLIPLTSVIF